MVQANWGMKGMRGSDKQGSPVPRELIGGKRERDIERNRSCAVVRRMHDERLRAQRGTAIVRHGSNWSAREF